MLKCVIYMTFIRTFSDYRVSELHKMVAGALALCLSFQHNTPGQ